MDLFRGRNQWLLLILIVVGVFVWRNFGPEAESQGPDLAFRQKEIQNLWLRVPSYPGSGNPTGGAVHEMGRIVNARLYPVQPGFEAARTFYDKELLQVGWVLIGEDKDVPGFQSPVRVYRNGDYHMLLSTSPAGVLLRITFSPDLDPLIDRKVMPDG